MVWGSHLQSTGRGVKRSVDLGKLQKQQGDVFRLILTFSMFQRRIKWDEKHKNDKIYKDFPTSLYESLNSSVIFFY